MKRSSITTFGILVAIVLLVASSLPAAAEVQQKVILGQEPTASQNLAEAEVARALVNDSPEMQEIRRLAAREGLYLRSERRPLRFKQEENGQRVYAADREAVLFLGDKEGRRIYQIFMGFEPSVRSSWVVPSVVDAPRAKPWEKSDRETTFVFAFVDLAVQEVLDVVWVEISRADSDGSRSVLMKNAGGRQANLQMSRTGALTETAHNNGLPTETTQVYGVQPTGVCLGGLLCFLVSFLACTVLCVPLGAVTAIVGGVVCAFVCELVFWWVCSHACD